MKILLTTDGSVYSEGAAMFLSRFNLSRDDEILVLTLYLMSPPKTTESRITQSSNR